MVEVNECGAYVNPDDPSELCTLILEWKENKELLDRMGKNARKLAETTYDKSILCKKFVSIVHSITSQT
jgi:glycosyltransferase involved in cell wall biosynthesis